MAHDSPSVDDIGFFWFVHMLCFELLVPEFFLPTYRRMHHPCRHFARRCRQDQVRPANESVAAVAEIRHFSFLACHLQCFLFSHRVMSASSLAARDGLLKSSRIGTKECNG